MSRQANPTLIGAFVLGALGLAVGAVLLLAGNQLFFSQTERFVMYFDGSVKGLTVGSPVMFRGVHIGTVVSMQLLVTEDDAAIAIPVVVEIDHANFSYEDPQAESDDGDADAEEMARLIKAGLRAQLQLQSLLTGQLFIQVDFYPNTPINLRKGALFADMYEIPTIPTPIEKLAKTLEDFPFDEVLQSIKSTMEGIDALVNSPRLTASIASLDSALQETQALMQTLNRRVDPLTDNFDGAINDARGVMQHLDTALKDAREAVRQAEETLQSADKVIDNQRVVSELEATLRNISQAANSIRLLTEALERQPEILLRGRQ